MNRTQISRTATVSFSPRPYMPVSKKSGGKAVPRALPRRDAIATMGMEAAGEEAEATSKRDKITQAAMAPMAFDWSVPFGSRKKAALGYHPDLPDHRDYGPAKLDEFVAAATKVKPQAFELGAPAKPRVHLGDESPLPPIEDQRDIGSCTAQAVIGMVEFLILRHTGETLDLSRMFLYKSTRRLLGWTGDTGAYLRSTIKALTFFGTPPENEWPYDDDLLDIEPDAYQYAFAQNYKSVKYARLDSVGSTGPETLKQVKQTIGRGFPAAFGFPVYRSIETMDDSIIPLPTPTDDLLGGHAVLAVGYDDGIQCERQEGRGALIIRNSWGTGWGDHGYGYLPYDYVRRELAVDFWTVYDKKWIGMNQFEE
jgi:C1A family cysteine protease